jgi:nucleoside-diphosphate-sugar epimerase
LKRSDVSGRRALVTGATGFIGRRLVERLLDEGADVHAATRGAPPAGDGRVAWHRIDLTDEAAVRALVERTRPELVFHLASLVNGSPDVSLVVPTLRGNLLSTVNLLLATEAVRPERFVLAGTMMEPKAGEPTDAANSPYAVAKWAASGYGRLFHALYGLPVVTIRVHMVYGPGQVEPHKLMAHVALSTLRGEPAEVSSGAWEIDWIYLDDIVAAFMAAATAPGAAGATVDGGTGRLTSLREVVARLAAALDPDVLPDFGAREDRPLEFPRRADPATWAAIGWRPEVPLEEGLARTEAWFREQLAAGRM